MGCIFGRNSPFKRLYATLDTPTTLAFSLQTFWLLRLLANAHTVVPTGASVTRQRKCRLSHVGSLYTEVG